MQELLSTACSLVLFCDLLWHNRELTSCNGLISYFEHSLGCAGASEHLRLLEESDSESVGALLEQPCTSCQGGFA